MTDYKIYLVNETSNITNFWCFLQAPEGIPSSSVFANSDTMLNVMSDYGGTNHFTIPLQYVVGAGAGNRAVRLDERIEHHITQNAQLGEVWRADYATAPPKQGPRLSRGFSGTSANTIGIQSNSFDQVKNEQERWNGHVSFGIQTPNGFMGVTWSPSPNMNYTLTPKLTFYIARGNYESNCLADLNEISNHSAKIELADFQNFEVTVMLTRQGTWAVRPGKPPRR